MRLFRYPNLLCKISHIAPARRQLRRPATVRRRGDVPPNPNRVGPRLRSAQRPRPRNPHPPRTMRRMTRSTIAPTTATPKLGQFHPVTPDCPNCCLLYTSDAADDLTRVDIGGRRIIKK